MRQQVFFAAAMIVSMALASRSDQPELIQALKVSQITSETVKLTIISPAFEKFRMTKN